MQIRSSIKTFVALLLIFIGCTRQEKLQDENPERSPLRIHYSNLESGNIDSLQFMIDWETIETKLSKDLVQSPNIGNELIEDAKSGIVKDLIPSIKVNFKGGLFRLSNRYNNKSKQHDVYEMFNGVDFDYMELKIDSSSLLIEDIMLYSDGEFLTGQITNYGNLLKNDDFKKNLNLVSRIKKAIVQKDYQTAWNYSNSIPEEFRMSYPYRSVYLKVLQFEPDLMDEYLAQLVKQNLNKRFIDYIFFKQAFYLGDHQLLLNSKKSLEKYVGHSAVVKVFTALSYEENGNYEMALKEYNEVIEMCPNNSFGYVNLIEYLIENDNEKEAYNVILSSMEHLKLKRRDWEAILASYPDFINSIEFRKLWSKENK